MILVTGGTGFIGRHVIQQLSLMGYPVRALLRPTPHSPNLPTGIGLEVVICGLDDVRGLRAAMNGVDAVIHLAGAEYTSSKPDLNQVDILGTQNLAQAAAEADLANFIYLSHLGADQNSGYPVLRAKGIAERMIRERLPEATILRSALVYGMGDHFTQAIVRQIRQFPFIFLVPGDGNVQIQPIVVDDLATILCHMLETRAGIPKLLSVGGPEFLSLRETLTAVFNETGMKRRLVFITPAYLRILSVLFEKSWKDYLLTLPWIDYFAADRTCSLDELPHFLGLMPQRFSRSIRYLQML